MVAWVALVTIACSPGSDTFRESSTISLDLHSIVDSVRTESAVPAIAAAIAGSEGPPTITVVGVRDINSGTAIQEADVFEIGSVTKSVAATALAVLVDEGRLTWDTRVADILSSAGMRQEYRGVSVSMLLRHRAGVTRLQSPDPEMERAIDRLRGTPIEQRAVLIDWMLTRAPAFVPGTSYEYSNGGYVLAVGLAEKVTGLSFEHRTGQGANVGIPRRLGALRD